MTRRTADAAPTRPSKVPDVERVLGALSSHDVTKLAAGVACMVGGQALIWFVDGVDMVAGVGLLASFFGAVLAWQWFREKNPQRAPVVRALLDMPSTIVWVYDRAVWKGRVQVAEVHVHLDTGQRTVLTAPDTSEGNELVDVFRRRVPTAVIGWDRETELR